MWLVVLVVYVSPLAWVAAYDGCDVYLDILCGDKCAPQDKYCQCGNNTNKLQQYFDYDDWCCLPPGESCSDAGGNISCPAGTKQLLTQPCQGNCNHWPDDPYNARRSYLLCDAAVNNSSGTGGHCLLEKYFGDGEKYECLDRTDEKPFKLQEKEGKKTNFSRQLFPCNVGFGPGLNCSGFPGQCLPYYLWCHPYRQYSCLSDLSSQDPELCADYTYWAGHNCTHPVLGDGKRCGGDHTGRCVYPQAEYEGARRVCPDSSDSVHQQNTSCPQYSTESNTHCSHRLRKYCGFSEYSSHITIYPNYYDYWYFCLSCYDPSNCTDSCVQPDHGAAHAVYTRDEHTHCRWEGGMVYYEI